MFKRVTKHAKRQQEIDGLELTEEAREALRAQDTDSDESELEASGSESNSSKEQIIFHKRKREDSEDVEEHANDLEGDEVDQGAAEEASTMTVQEALKSSLEDSKCVFCPGKVLKNLKMEHVHLNSSHHKRRLKRFQELVKRLSAEFDDIYSDQAAAIVGLMAQPDISQKRIGNEGDALKNLSNRAKKRRKVEVLKEKKRKYKERAARENRGEAKKVKKGKKADNTDTVEFKTIQ